MKIKGVVHPLGPGAGRKPGEQDLWFGFSLLAWRRDGEPIAEGELYVRKRIPSAAVKEWMSRVKPHDVVSLDVEFVDEATRVVGQIITLEGSTHDDTELAALAVRFQEPVTIVDELLGTLSLDRSLDRFEGQVLFGKDLVDLAVDGADTTTVQPNLNTARLIVSDAQVWLSSVTAYAVAELLPLKNECWLDEAEPPLDAERFASRITLDAVNVGISGSFEFWFDDGDLFLGHSIVVAGDLSRGPTRAQLEG
jgi:hypothetical protein